MDTSYGDAAMAMMCPDCKMRLRFELDGLNLKATKNPVIAMRQAKRLIKVINNVCCDDCRAALQSEGVRWHHDHPNASQGVRR